MNGNTPEMHSNHLGKINVNDGKRYYKYLGALHLAIRIIKQHPRQVQRTVIFVGTEIIYC